MTSLVCDAKNKALTQKEDFALYLLHYPIDIYLTWNLHVISKELGAIVRELIYAFPRILRGKFWKQKESDSSRDGFSKTIDNTVTKILKDCIIISVGGNINKYSCFVCDAVPLEPFENVIFFVAV